MIEIECRPIFILGLLSVFYSLNAMAFDIQLEDRTISLPAPDGFVELTPKMSPYYETLRAYVGPTNVRHLTLIGQDEADALLRGEVVDLARYINVETPKNMSGTSVSSTQFMRLRNLLRTQIEELYAKAEAQLPEIIGEANKVVSSKLSADVAVELGGMVPLPIHLDTDNAIANSMYMTVDTTVDEGARVSEVLSATTLVLHVKAKVLFLYIYGQESDLEWTRDTASKLSAAIVQANPLSDSERLAVARSESRAIDWNAVIQKAAIGAVIGGIFGLISLFFRKRKKE